eukprot:CAMPEP_0198545368 /NCGR_PEP_ID=MMETSP1462-20131121/63849_1 /TAXON_ID=1333877 /ORGANISM="Brandtodinium nutriculum, Strain RCC3387" /LENGTH=421 /DNA_ID=CAMNT_0044275747 /DNA_START=84 /DNA_END=1348 /DNA_ORIENTATION=+
MRHRTGLDADAGPDGSPEEHDGQDFPKNRSCGRLSLAVRLSIVFVFVVGCVYHIARVKKLRKGWRIDSQPKFYVYSGNGWIDWMSMRCNGSSLNEVVDPWVGKIPFKHTDDYWFVKAALAHPGRVSNPEDADLFVVPAMLNFALEQMLWRKEQCCVGDICNADLIIHTEMMLAQSPWFKRHGGKDHVIVCSHWACARTGISKHNLDPFKNIQACNTVAFEENSMRGDRCRIATTLVGRGCQDAPSEYGGSATIDRNATVVMVASMHAERSKFQQRRDICKWAEHASHVIGSFTISRCGPGPQCPAVAQARFGFHVRGDTLGSNRLIDYILSGTVPIFTDERQYDILPPFVPWRNMSFLIDASDEDEFVDAIGGIMQRYDAAKAVLDANAASAALGDAGPFREVHAVVRALFSAAQTKVGGS